MPKCFCSFVSHLSLCILSRPINRFNLDSVPRASSVHRQRRTYTQPLHPCPGPPRCRRLQHPRQFQPLEPSRWLPRPRTQTVLRPQPRCPRRLVQSRAQIFADLSLAPLSMVPTTRTTTLVATILVLAETILFCFNFSLPINGS